MKTVKDKIQQAIDKHFEEIAKLQAITKDLDEPAFKVCPECNTKNYHYYADTDCWCCAFC